MGKGGRKEERMENGREHLNSVDFCIMIVLFFYSKNSFNPRTYKGVGGGGLDATPLRFSEFFS